MNTKQHSKSTSNRKQKGFTLIEIMVAVAIMAIGIAALAWGINKAFAGNDIKDESGAVTKVMAAIPDLRTSTGYGISGTNLVPQLIAQNEIPSVWPVIAGVPQNSWGGTIAVTSNVSNVNISSAGISQEGCNKLVVKLSKGANFKTTKINANTAITGEVSAAQAQAQCTTGANTIIWTTQN